MDRNVILDKNKQAKVRDEGTEFVDNPARQKGEALLMSFMLLLMIYNYFKGIPSYDLMTVFWAYGAVTNLYKYLAYRRKSDLVTTIFTAIAALCSFMNYFSQTW